MHLNSYELLTHNQRAELMLLYQDISEIELEHYYSLSFEDIDIINNHRLNYNKLGFALQITILRHTGWPLIVFENIPQKILCYLANQLDVDSNDFDKYFDRRTTKYEHLESICCLYKYKKYEKDIELFLSNQITEIAKSESNSFKLVSSALNILRNNKIIIPSIRSIEQLVWIVKNNIQDYIFDCIYSSLSTDTKDQLEKLIAVQYGEINTKLTWLREIPGKASSKTFNAIADRIEYIRGLELENIDFSNIHNNKIEELFKLGSKYESYDFKRFESKKRYAILSVYLIKLCKRLVDQAIQIHDIQIQNIQSFGKKEQENLMKRNGKKANLGLHNYVELGKMLIKNKEEDKTSIDFKNIEDGMSTVFCTTFIRPFSLNDILLVTYNQEHCVYAYSYTKVHNLIICFLTHSNP